MLLKVMVFIHKMDKKLKEILIKIVLTVIVLVFLSVLLTKRFIYFRPSSDFIPINETYKVVNQGHLHGWLADGHPGSKIILLCHSNKGNVSHVAHFIEKFKNLGFSVLAFDYSGFGKSRGIPSEQQLYDDVSYMTALLRQTYQQRDIILVGHGLGAPVATYAARRYGIPTLVLLSPFVDARSIVNNTLLSFMSVMFSEFNTAEYLRGYQGRSLMIHSTTDEYVSYNAAAELRELVTLHIPSSGTHEGVDIPWEQVKRFIETT